MRQIFLCVLSLSLSGALTGLVLLLIHPFTKGVFSKRWNYYIWLLVAARLLIPVYVAAPFQGTVETQKTPVQSVQTREAPGEAHKQAAEAKVEGNLMSQNAPGPAADPEMPHNAGYFPAAAAMLWLLGVMAALAFRLAGYRYFVRDIRKNSHPLTDGEISRLGMEMAARLGMKRMPQICESAHVPGPVTVGLRRPVIYLPEGIGLGSDRSPCQTPELSLVLHHELVHVKRKDLWYKWLYQIILCVHWFNPVLYLVRRQIDIDCELSCDEAVLGELTQEGRSAYGNMLITAAQRSTGAGRSMPATTLLERKKDLKERLGAILHYKKQSAVRVLACVCISTCLLFLSACAGGRPQMPGLVTVSFPASDGESADSKEREEDSLLERFGKALLGLLPIDEDSFMSQTFAPDKKGEPWRAYDEDALIAGEDIQDKWSAYVYSQNKGKITSHGFLFDGTDTILIAYAKRDTVITLNSSWEAREGRFKLVHVTPQEEVIVIDDTGEQSRSKVSLTAGRNVIKIVGQGAKLQDLAVSVSGIHENDFEEVYYSEADEYLRNLLTEISKGAGKIEKEKVMDVLFMAEEKEVSEIFAAMLKQGMTFSPDELQEFLIYSDAALSTSYLADAVENGDSRSLDREQLSAVIPYIKGEGRMRLLNAMSGEAAFDCLEEWAPYLEDDEWEMLLMDYTDKNKLTYSQILSLYPYLDEGLIERLDEKQD